MGCPSALSKAMWADPAFRARCLPKVRDNLAKARASRMLSGETLDQFLREYMERDPSGRRRWRYSKRQLAARYLVADSTVWAMAKRHGLKRADQPCIPPTKREAA
jgi:hypothetical protein